MKITLKNNVRTTMSSRNINMWKELAERLQSNQNYSITRTSLARQIDQESPAYSLKLIEALCNELQCLPNDLFWIEATEMTPEEIRHLTKRDKPFEFGYLMGIEGATGASKTQASSTVPAPMESHPKTAPLPILKEGESDEDDLIGEPITHLSLHPDHSRRS